MCEALVLYDYTATEEDELTIKKGDILKEVVLIEKDSLWYEGLLNNKRGLFPFNYVKTVVHDVKKMYEAIVVYDYKAEEPDELTIKKGDVIKDIVEKSAGWAEGLLNDKRGLFPDNYVKIIDKDVTYRNKDAMPIRQCRVVYSYQPVHPDELSLNVGDTIQIVGEDEEGWWRGVHSGKEGVFPSNFVEEVFPSKPKQKHRSREDLSNNVSDSEVRIPSLPPKPKKVLCEVKYAYKAMNDDELSLREGDIITVTNRELPDPGWWEGELNGKTGVFPDNFVSIIKSTDSIPSDKHVKAITDSSPSKNTAVVSKRTSLEFKVDTENKTNPPQIQKKPSLPKKKSPSTTTNRFLSGIVSRKSDSVDGLVSSKGLRNDLKVEIPKENVPENAFDQVERNPLLKDVRACRAKPPIRRPPTSGMIKDKSASDTEIAPLLDEDTTDSKPQMREWEKHKAPWLEEMKMNQAKRSSTSPVSEKNLNTKGLYPELDKSPVDTVMSKSMPCPVIQKTSPIDLENKTSPSSLKTKTNNIQNLARNNYSNVDIPLSVNNAVTIANAKPVSTNKHRHSNSNETHNSESDNRASGEFTEETVSLTVQQYTELLERIQRLEILVERQTSSIEDLRANVYIKDKRRNC